MFTSPETLSAFVLLVFGVVYLGMILGGLPRLPLDRMGVALLGASIAVAALLSGIFSNDIVCLAVAPVLLGCLALWAWLAWQHRHPVPVTAHACPTTHSSGVTEDSPFDRWQTAKGLIVVTALMLVLLLTDWQGAVAALVGAGLLLPSQRFQTGATLALVSTLAGNLLIVGSMANIIVVDAGRRAGILIDWRRHPRTGVPVTLLTLAIAAAWLHLQRF